MGKFIKMAAIAVFAALFFTACSSSDDDKLAKAALGEYNVTIKLPEFPVEGDTLKMEDKTVLLEKNGEYVNISLNLDLKDMGFGVIPIKIEGATLSGEKNDMTINYSGKMVLPKDLLPPVESSAIATAEKGENEDENEEVKTAEVETTINGTLKNEKDITLKIEVKGTIAGDLEINVTGKRSTKEA